MVVNYIEDEDHDGDNGCGISGEEDDDCSVNVERDGRPAWQPQG